MLRRCAVGLAAWLLLSAGSPAQAIVLRYRPEVNEVTKHKMSMAGSARVSMEGMGQVMQMELTGSLDYAEKALSETDETTRVETRLLGGTMTAKVSGESHTQPMPTGRTVVDRDRRGRLVKIVEAEFENLATPQLMGPGAETWTNMPNQFGAFPEGDIEVNDSWSEQLEIPTVPGGPEIGMTINSRLLALTTFQGHKCAKIRSSFEGPIKLDLSELGTPTEGVEGTMEATLQGDMLWYYDYENSVHVHYEGAVGMEMNLAMSGPDAPAGSMSTQVLMDVKMTLER